MIKDYSDLTSRIYTQLSPELSQEFHNMLTDMAKEISRLESIDNAKPSKALELIDSIREYSHSLTMVNYLSMNFDLDTIKQYILKAQEQEKVLEILFKKQVDLGWLWYCIHECINSLNEYNKKMPIEKFKLTQEEFDLLKRY